jgi:hypothetical protein
VHFDRAGAIDTGHGFGAQNGLGLGHRGLDP